MSSCAEIPIEPVDWLLELCDSKSSMSSQAGLSVSWIHRRASFGLAVSQIGYPTVERRIAKRTNERKAITEAGKAASSVKQDKNSNDDFEVSSSELDGSIARELSWTLRKY